MQVTAQAMNLIIPALVMDLQEARSAFNLPPNYSQWYGTYGTSFSISIGPPGAKYPPGALGGTFASGNMPHIAFFWDPVQDIAATRTSPAKTAFRYNNILAPAMSCFGFTGSGTNGVAYFFMIGKRAFVDLPDLPVFGLPRTSTEY
jgi:hypothetical protein